MNIKITGLDELDKLQKKLDNASRTASKLAEGVSFDDIFTRDFMYRSTKKYPSLRIFLKHGGFSYKTQSQFEAIPEKALDAYIKKATLFKSWSEMLSTASQEYFDFQL